MCIVYGVNKTMILAYYPIVLSETRFIKFLYGNLSALKCWWLLRYDIDVAVCSSVGTKTFPYTATRLPGFRGKLVTVFISGFFLFSTQSSVLLSLSRTLKISCRNCICQNWIVVLYQKVWNRLSVYLTMGSRSSSWQDFLTQFCDL